MTSIVLCGAVRTPIGQFLGTLSDIPTVELGAICAQETIKRSKIPVDKIDEVILGHVLAAGDGQNPARQVAKKAGLANEVPAIQSSVLCGSGLRSVIDGVRAIKAGDAKFVLCGGMESMSRAGHVQKLRKPLNKKFGPIKLTGIESDLKLMDTMLTDGLMCALTNQHMGNTAENIAKEFNISRADQDSFAKNSHSKALAAIKNGLFKNEIVAVPVGDKSFDTDECPTDLPLAEYESYPSVFMKEGTVTKGNACGLNDGASTVLVADKEQAVSLGLDIQAEVIGTAMTGNDPNTMGLGPVYAIQKLLKTISMKIEDIDYFELNEAFAAQSLACVRQLNIPEDKVNVHGGSIALGHPIGCSGSRILATLINVLKEKNAKTGIASLCIGGGMGIAIAIKLQ